MFKCPNTVLGECVKVCCFGSIQEGKSCLVDHLILVLLQNVLLLFDVASETGRILDHGNF